MKRTLIISAGTLTNDGYQTRIEMEMELLKDYFEFVIITSEKSKGVSVSTPCKIKYYSVNKYKTKIANIISNGIEYKKCLEDTIDNSVVPIIYCESLMPLLRTLRIAKKRATPCVYDCHGIQPIEYRLYHPGIKGLLYSKLLAFREKRYVKDCNLIITVTDKQYDIWNCSTKQCKLPMIPGENFLREPVANKEAAKEVIGIPSDALVFVYSGGTNKWQMCSETMKMYSEIEKEVPEAFLLVLSHDTDTFKTLSHKYGIRRLMIKSVGYDEMPKYLDACDFGFCIREDNIINNVASPTKLLEYIARNVTPIMSNNIGEYSAMFKEKNLAIIVDNYKTFKFSNNVKNNNGFEFVREYKKKIVNNYIRSVTGL